MNSDWKAKLESLPRELDPPPDLGTRITADLMRRGLLRPRSRWGLVMAPAVIASIAFAAGFFAGRPGTSFGVPQFMVLLYQDQAFEPAQGQDLVAEYGAWARQMGRAGHLIEGHRLTAARQRLGNSEPNPDVLTGFFRIRAENWAEALALAQNCPHLKYGGTVEIRLIDPDI